MKTLLLALERNMKGNVPWWVGAVLAALLVAMMVLGFVTLIEVVLGD